MKFIKHSTTRILMVIALTVIISALSWNPALAVELPDYQVVAENHNLTLLFNETTTEVAVYDQRTDQFWFSNPSERNTVEKIARGAAKDALGAQLRINYFSPTDIQRTMDNYNDSIAYGQFEITHLDNGIRVDYLLGKEWDDQYYLPLIVEKNLYENEFIVNLSTRDQRTIGNLFALIEIIEAPEGVTATLANKYAINSLDGSLSARDLRTIHEVFLDHLVRYKDSITTRNDVKEADIVPFLGKPLYIFKQRERDMLPWDKDALIALVRDSGFDPYMIGEGYGMYEMDPGKPNVILFSVPIEYTLDEDNLVVRVPAEEVEYPKNVINAEGQRVTYPLVSIDVLPYFGAADPNSEGYIFVPDGSGALIYLNNGKTHLSAYGRRIYGRDIAVSQPEQTILTRQNKLPVFGLKEESKAWVAIIEDGASIAQINADVSGRRISYNTVYPQFRIIEYVATSLQGGSDSLLTENIHRASSQWVLSGKDSINVYQDPKYAGDLKVKYAFLPEEDASYVGMAHYYQDYLVNRYSLERVQPQENIPFYLELLGAVSDRQPIFGVPRQVMIPLTKYEEAATIVKDIFNRGITNLNLTYTGWMRHGLTHDFPTKIRLEPVLGSKQELQQLNQLVTNSGGHFYPDVGFMQVNKDALFDGFRVTRDATRGLNRKAIDHLLSPGKLDKLVGNYLKSHSEYEFSGIALRDLNVLLYSDYRQNKNLGREAVIQIVEDLLSKMVTDSKLDIQMSSANAYAIPYASSMTNIPLKDSGLDIVDESIPFLPIVLHGYVNYAGEPLNFVGDSREYLLQMVEIGANPYYRGFQTKADVLKGSLYSALFTGEFSNWIAEAENTYAMLNQHFKDVQNLRIVAHQRVADNLYLTVYENGKSVVVNYGDKPTLFNGVTVESKSFQVFKGDDLNEE